MDEVEGRPLIPAMRAMVFVSLALTAIAFVDLFVGAGRTADNAPWTVNPPLTAAFLGAGFGAGFVLFLLAARERVWVNARVAIVTVWEFTVVILIATLMHDDKFHLDAGSGLARAAAWLWLAVYILFPVVVGVLIVVQERTPGTDPPVTRPLPPLLNVALALQGLVMVGIGLALFAKPLRMNEWWPWTLTPLTARAIAAWFLALGVAAFQAILERDLPRLRIAAVTYLVFAILQYLAVARYRDDVDWDSGWSWAYLAWVAFIGIVAVYGVVASQPRARADGRGIDLTASSGRDQLPSAPARRSRARSQR
jgi:hypothetical protein